MSEVASAALGELPLGAVRPTGCGRGGTESAVVVHGPPGTGRTHMIANLVSALLARGRRVPPTIKKDQALKMLLETIPPELRRVRVLLAGGFEDAAEEFRGHGPT